MKRSKSKNLTQKMVLFLGTVLLSGSLAMAQPKPESGLNIEAAQAFERLDAMMASAEQEIKYVAPVDVYDDIRSAMERLELLAEKTEEDIRYSATENPQPGNATYMASEDKPAGFSAAKAIALMTFILPTVK
jgi:hypothetical protein